jgi:uncharacterized membrane-anchored protein
MRLRELLHEVGVDVDATKDVLDSGRLERPWYVHAALSALLWTGALSLMGALAAFDVLDEAIVQAVVGAAFFALAVIASRVTRGLLRLNLSLLGYAGTTVFLFAFLAEGLRADKAITLACILAVQAVVLFAVRARPVRFKASVGIWLASFALLTDELRVDGAVYVVAVAAVVVACFAFEAEWTKRGLDVAVRPLGFASALALLFSGLWAQDHPLRATPALLLVGLALVLLAVGVGVARRADLALSSRVALLVSLVGVVALVHSRPAILGALVLLVVGRMRGERILEVLGFVGAAVFVLVIYHDLELSLLWTSGALTAAGLLLLVLRAVLLATSTDATSTSTVTSAGSVLSPVHTFHTPRMRPALALPMIAVLGLTLGLVVDRESLRAHGDTLLVELAPADPRSLLQGDYLRLRFKHTDNLDYRSEGVLIVDVDADHVVTAAKDDDGSALAAGQHRLRFHRVQGTVVFGAPTYFIPEGTGHTLESARYAEFRVDVDGTPLLVGLRDRDRAVLHRTE